MPASFFSAVGGFLLDAGKQTVLGSSMMGQAQQLVNQSSPILYAPFSEAIKLYYQGKISWGVLANHAAFAGAYLPPTDTQPDTSTDAGWRSSIWRKVIQSGTPVPDLDSFRTFALRNPEHMDLFRRHMRHYGMNPDLYANILLYPPNPPTPLQAMEMLNRGYIAAEEFDRMMQAYGMGSSVDRTNMQKLRLIVPPIADLIRFSVREVWQDDVVQRFGYDDEFPQAFQHWMNKQGLGWTPGPDTVEGFGNSQIPWPLAYWRSHWEVLSPSAAFELFHRARPDETDPTKSRIPGIRPFTQADLDRILKVHDYPPTMREWLRGLSYARLNRTDIRRAIQIGAIFNPEATQRFMDLGYTAADSQLLFRMAVKLGELARDRTTITRLRTQLLTAYELGTVTRQSFQVGLYAILNRGTERLDEFNRLDDAGKADLAARDSSVILATREVDLRVQNARIKTAIKSLVKAYIEGRLTRDELSNRLASAGVAENRISDIVVRADWQKSAAEREPTLDRLSRWRKSGLLSAGDYRAELLALGFSSDDANRFVFETESTIVASVAKTEEVLARTTQQSRRAILTQIKAYRDEQRRAQRRLVKTATKAEVSRWYKKGLVDYDTASDRLRKLGYTEEDTKLILAAV